MHNLFIFTGQPGTGKSTWSASLARACKGCFIDIDTHFAHVVEAGLRFGGHEPQDRDSETFKKAFREPIYSSMFALAKDNLPHTDVVMNGPFTYELSQANWRSQLARAFQANVRIVYLTCDEMILKKRIQQRGLSRDTAKLAHWNTYQQRFKNKPTPLCQHTRVDTGTAERDAWITAYLKDCGVERKNGG